MSSKAAIDASAGILAHVTLPPLSFPHQGLSSPLIDILIALSEKRPENALSILEHSTASLLRKYPAAPAALQSAAALHMRDYAAAERSARRSLKNEPNQWMSRHVLLHTFIAHRRFEVAYDYLYSFTPSSPRPVWDTELNDRDRHMTLAAWAWRQENWSVSVDHILDAYPDGLHTMPLPLRCDVLRLALTADRPSVAGTAAGSIITASTDREADEILQALVHKDWLQQALPLYERLAQRSPNTPWIRRRLIGLCLRVGAVEKARQVRAALESQ